MVVYNGVRITAAPDMLHPGVGTKMKVTATRAQKVKRETSRLHVSRVGTPGGLPFALQPVDSSLQHFYALLVNFVRITEWHQNVLDGLHRDLRHPRLEKRRSPIHRHEDSLSNRVLGLHQLRSVSPSHVQQGHQGIRHALSASVAALTTES